MACCSRLVIFYLKENYLFFVSHASASHLQDVCFPKRSEDLVEKIISAVTFDKLFIQRVKCSFFSHIIVDQSFYGHSARLVIFYFEEKFFVLHTSASHLRDVYLQSVPKTLSKKYLTTFWLYLTQIDQLEKRETACSLLCGP